MGVWESLNIWRGLGALLGTRVGASGSKALSGVVNAGAAVMAPRIEGEVPFVKPKKPLAESRVAFVTTGGIHLDDQEPYDTVAKDGDPAFRVLPSDADTARLRVTHEHYAHRFVDQDVNVLYPIDRLRELEEAGVLKVAPRCFGWGFAGTLTRALIQEPDGTAHQAARILKEDGVDLVLAAPA